MTKKRVWPQHPKGILLKDIPEWLRKIGLCGGMISPNYYVGGHNRNCLREPHKGGNCRHDWRRCLALGGTCAGYCQRFAEIYDGQLRYKWGPA
jgi:hypothetical protein